MMAKYMHKMPEKNKMESNVSITSRFPQWVRHGKYLRASFFSGVTAQLVWIRRDAAVHKVKTDGFIFFLS